MPAGDSLVVADDARAARCGDRSARRAGQAGDRVAAADRAGSRNYRPRARRQCQGVRSLPARHAAAGGDGELASGARVLRAVPRARSHVCAGLGRTRTARASVRASTRIRRSWRARKSAFLRALELDPDNGAAQYYYAQLEIDLGRLDAALARLLERVRHRRAEPHIYAALVHACRYGGLLDESLAAHRQAQRLDPTLPTTVHHTYYMQGDYERALAAAGHGADPFEAAGPLGAGPGGRSPGQRAPGGGALRVRAVDARVLVGVACRARGQA